MKIEEFLSCICEQIKYKPIREEISKEIEDHIEELKENFIEDDIDENTSEEKAIQQMGNAQEIGKQLNKIHKPRLDWKLVLITIILICFGFLVAFIKNNNIRLGEIQPNYVAKYLYFTLIGLIIGIVIYFVDYKKICKYSNIIYLLATITILWSAINGSLLNGRAFMRIGTIFVSTSVICVPLYVIAFVGFLENVNKQSKLKIECLSNININLIKIIVLSIISIILLLEIPSLISAFILTLIYVITATIKIIDLKENRLKRILKLWGILAILGIILLSYLCLESPYRINRFMVSFNPESDPAGGGWFGINRKTIIDSAHFFGEADNKSNAIDLFDEGTNYAFISILAHCGWGISMAMVITIVLLSIKLIISAIKVKDIYGKLLVIGLSSMFIMQSIFNILMNLNLWIEADFNIPFVSYGGFNLIVNIMCLALILSIYRKKDIIINKNIVLDN